MVVNRCRGRYQHRPNFEKITINLERRYYMFTRKRIIILGIIVIVGFILGRLAFRTFLNILVGGTLFGGNLL